MYAEARVIPVLFVAMGGDLMVGSILSEGSTFTLSLPRGPVGILDGA
jgi:signal transduction histidine kinase